MLLVQQALQAKALRDNLKALQQTQPQLTQLTHNVRQGAENSYAVTTSAEVDAFSGAVVGAIVLSLCVVQAVRSDHYGRRRGGPGVASRRAFLSHQGHRHW
jgi:hypothetical protein